MLAWVVIYRRHLRHSTPIFYLCVLSVSALSSPTLSLNHSPLSPIFRTLFQVPYPATPLFATLTKTAGVCTNNSHSGTCYPTGVTTSLSPYLLTSLPHYVLTSLLHDRRCSARPLQHGSRRVGFFADVAHANDARWVPDSCGAGDVADFFAFQHQDSLRFGHGVAGKEQFHAAAVDLAAGAHALDDLLAGVAALRIADMAGLQARLMRDLFFSEVIAEPRHTLRQPQPAQCRVSHGPAAVLPRRTRKNPPELPQLFAFDHEFSSSNSSRRSLYNSPGNRAAGNRTNGAIARGKVLKLGDVDAGQFLHDRGGLRTFQRQSAVACRLIGQRHVIHDDVLVEPFDQPLANHRVRHAEEPVREGASLSLCENVPLRIQQQRNAPLPCAKVLNVVRQNRV